MLTNYFLKRFIIIIISVTRICYVYMFTNVNTLTSLKISKQHRLPVQYATKAVTYDYQEELETLNNIHVADDDLKLIKVIRNKLIENPSVLPYNLKNSKQTDPSEGQAAVVDRILHRKERGFFVDCGANEGEALSNSLFFERFRNWEGILIEANPTVYKGLKEKNRKSFTLNACLNTKPYPALVTFLEDSWWGKILEGNYSKSYRGIGGKGRFIQVQCFPLYSILLALNHTKVDYLSLDVEGAEEGVLNSIPWNKVDIRTLSIEYNKWPGGKTALITYMEKKGYKAITEIKTGAASDVVFMKDQMV